MKAHIHQVEQHKMKLIVVLATLFAFAFAAPRRMVMPRLPTSVLLSGDFEMIPENKIVGGAEVVPYSLPFQISLQRRSGNTYSHMCGGSILDENSILDAAHCVDGMTAGNLRVVAGEHSLSQYSGAEQISAVVSFVANTAYDPNTLINDIAIIKLETPLTLVSTVQAVNLPPPTSELDPPAGTIVTVSGWGATSEGGALSDVLLSVDVPVVSDFDCDIAYGGNENSTVVFPSMLCAGGPDGGIDSCQGDSGGPLFTGTGADAVQHGIVSWGIGCAQAAYPGVYTQVSFYLDWITANRG